MTSEQIRLASELASARRQERLYRELFEDSLGLMCVHDLEGVLLIVNPAAARSLGYRPEDGVGVNMKRFLAPEVQGLFDGYLERIRRNGSDSGLMRLIARDGSQRTWLYRNVLYEEPGTPPRVLGHALDISERVGAEEALKESERRFRSMADTAPVFIWMSDAEGQCVFVNRAFLSFTGRTLEQELGQGWTENFYPEDRERAITDLRAAYAARREFRAEYRMRRADGAYRWILDTGTPRFDTAGQFAGYIGSCLDVTEARQDRDELAHRVAARTAELEKSTEALRVSEQLYEDLAEMSPVGIFRTDRDGYCVYLNQRACEIAGVSIEEAGQGKLDRMLEPEDRERFQKEWCHAAERTGTVSVEHRIVRGDGSTVWALTHLAAERDASGAIVGCIGTVADISDRKRAEEEKRRLDTQVQHTQRLQSLGILAGGLAHDFNNLLTVILGNARMALLDLPPGSPAVDKLAEIETATSRAAELTSQMLAYAGKGQVTLQTLDLSRLAAETVNLLQVVISKSIAFHLDLEDSIPSIQADPAQIRQVAMNLITNAAEAIGDDGGLIRVATGVVDADRAHLSSTYFDDQLPAGRYVYLEVHDTGCGMSAETQARIFDPFFTTKFTGRGLGLAAVSGIVRAHRGALKVSSQPGAGSAFQLLFPACDEPEAGRTGDPAKAGAHGRLGTVLVVDDEPRMRHLVWTILEKSGYNVLTADGNDAVRVFGRHAPEIRAVVLDVTMPATSGLETAAELRRMRPGVPIILSSGYGQQEAVARFAGQGLTGFLKKPYEPSELVEAVGRALAADTR